MAHLMPELSSTYMLTVENTKGSCNIQSLGGSQMGEVCPDGSGRLLVHATRHNVDVPEDH